MSPQENHEYRLSLVDLKDGSLRPITHSFCLPSFDLHRDEESLVYVTCPEQGSGPGLTAELHRWRTDGSDETLHTSVGLPLWSVLLSPAGDRVLLRGTAGVRVLDAQGTLRDLGPSEWQMLGWAGRDRLVIHEGDDDDPRLQVVNVTNGDRREVFPRNF